MIFPTTGIDTSHLDDASDNPQLARPAILDMAIKVSQMISLGTPIVDRGAVAADTNCDNLTENGIYRFESSEIVQTGTNVPDKEGGAGVMEVIRLADNGQTNVMQRFTDCLYGDVYIRSCYSNSWSAWYKQINIVDMSFITSTGKMLLGAADAEVARTIIGAAPAHQAQNYVSGDLIMSNGGQIVVNHGLGAEPMHISLYMRCVVADMGYAVGDVIRIAGDTDPNGSNESLGVLVNNTQIIVRVGDNGPQMITNKANGTGAAAMTARWRLIIKASK